MKNKNRGTTLIELLIYTALLGTVLTTLYQFFVQVSYQRINQVVQAELYNNGRRLLFDFQQEIKKATVITQPNLGENSDTLNLDNGSVIYTIDEQNRLTKTETGATNFLTDKEVLVQSLIFTHLGPSIDSPTLQISFTLQGRHLGESGPKQETFQTSVTLR